MLVVDFGFLPPKCGTRARSRSMVPPQSQTHTSTPGPHCCCCLSIFPAGGRGGECGKRNRKQNKSAPSHIYLCTWNTYIYCVCEKCWIDGWMVMVLVSFSISNYMKMDMDLQSVVMVASIEPPHIVRKCRGKMVVNI